MILIQTKTPASGRGFAFWHFAGKIQAGIFASSSVGSRST
jgi:hypothetical protein